MHTRESSEKNEAARGQKSSRPWRTAQVSVTTQCFLGQDPGDSTGHQGWESLESTRAAVPRCSKAPERSQTAIPRKKSSTFFSPRNRPKATQALSVPAEFWPGLSNAGRVPTAFHRGSAIVPVLSPSSGLVSSSVSCCHLATPTKT